VLYQNTDDYLRLMIQLRWIALLALCFSFLAANVLTEVLIHWEVILYAIGVGFFSNLVIWLFQDRVAAAKRVDFSRALLVIDSVLLAFILGGSGGAHNPFSSLYLLNVVLAAILFDRWTALIIAVIASGSFAFLYVGFPHLSHNHVRISHDLHIQGMVVVLGVMSFVIVLFVDRLKREVNAARNEREQKDRFEALATLATGVTHELSTPLGTIAIAAKELEKVADQSCMNVACKDDARLIREQVDRCRSIIDRLDQNSLNDFRNPGECFDVSELIEDLRLVLDIEELEFLSFNLDSSPMVIRAPRALLVQSLVNLVRNALLANFEKHPIRISCRLQNSKVLLQIVDQGTGMDVDTLRQVGNPFFTTRSNGEGIGMGVFIARSLIERIGGKFVIRSKPEYGTTVEITLPTVTRITTSHE
jgi:two-component system, sensor histidine kinase RegB